MLAPPCPHNVGEKLIEWKRRCLFGSSRLHLIHPGQLSTPHLRVAGRFTHDRHASTSASWTHKVRLKPFSRPEDTTVGGIEGLFIDYLKRHPDKGERSAVGLIGSALGEAFHC
jgi:hypothetical protein